MKTRLGLSVAVLALIFSAAKTQTLTTSDYRLCIATVALRDGPMTEHQFDYLMRFQEGYEGSALGHETVMYQWKQSGKLMCYRLAIMGRPIPTPKFEAPRSGDVAE